MIKNFEDKMIFMQKTPVEKLVCILAFPTIVSMLIGAVYSLADTYFVSRLGTAATAAVGIVFPIMSIMQGLGFLIGMGSGNYLSRLLGAKDKETAEHVASVGFFSSLAIGILLGILGLIFLTPILKLLGATENIFPFAHDFLFYIFLGTPFFVASFTLNNILRFQGSAFYAMIGIGIGTIINLFLNPFLIFMMDFGIKGSAIATCIGQIISFFILLWFCGRDGNLSIRFRSFKPSKHIYKIILRDGQPSFYRQGLASLSVVLLNLTTVPYGDDAIAAMSIVSRVMFVLLALLLGFGQGFQPVCGFHYGAKNYKEVLKAYFFCIKVSFITLFLCSIFFFWKAEWIISQFRMDENVVRIGALTLRLQSLTFYLSSFIIMANMLTQTIGKAIFASIIAFSRQGLFFIPFLFILPPFLGLFGIQLAQPFSDICSFLLVLPIQYLVVKELKKLQKKDI